MPEFFIANAANPDLVMQDNGIGTVVTVQPFWGGNRQKWDIPIGPGSIAASLPLAIDPVAHPGNPLGVVGGSVVPSPVPNKWNIVAADPVRPGQFRIQQFGGPGQFLAIPGALAAGAPVRTAGPAGANRNWILQLAD